MSNPSCLFLSILVPGAIAGCALIPGASYTAPECRTPTPHRAYFDPKTPDYAGSHVFGVPKANPAWWIENSDSPLPWWWKPDEEPGVRKRSWALRNPLHNFTNYVVGVADRPTRRYGLNAHSIWNESGPINVAVTQAGPLLWLPMFSYRGFLTEGYVGWRERGNLGASLRLAQHDSDGTGRAGNSPLSRAREEFPELDPDRPLPVLPATPANPGR